MKQLSFSETMNKYSSSRVEYDAYQSKYEQMEAEKKRSPEAIEEARQEAERYKEKFERLGKDVAEKIELVCDPIIHSRQVVRNARKRNDFPSGSVDTKFVKVPPRIHHWSSTGLGQISN